MKPSNFHILFFAISLLITFVKTDILRDKWMHANKIDPDYMHSRAMSVRSRAARLEHKIHHGLLSSVNNGKPKKNTPEVADIGDDINAIIPSIQNVSYGFINGTNTIKSNAICTSAIVSVIDYAFGLVNVRWFWVPEYLMKFQNGYNSLVDSANTAYAYCNFAQTYSSIATLWDPESTEAIGRLISRVLSSMAGDWWYQTNCIVDGSLGRNYYDIGYCSGKLFVIIFDTTIG